MIWLWRTFINPKSFFTSWAVQFIWLLEGPPREEIFPAALSAQEHTVQTQSQEGNAFPTPFSLLQPAMTSQPLPREGHTWHHSHPSASTFCTGSPPVPCDSCPQPVEYFPNKGRKGGGLTGPTAGCQLPSPSISDASASKPFVVSTDLSREGRMKPLLSGRVSPVSGVTDNT